MRCFTSPRRSSRRTRERDLRNIHRSTMRTRLFEGAPTVSSWPGQDPAIFRREQMRGSSPRMTTSPRSPPRQSAEDAAEDLADDHAADLAADAARHVLDEALGGGVAG